MNGFNLGPDWFWKSLGIFFGLGIIFVIIIIVKLIIWLYQHIPNNLIWMN